MREGTGGRAFFEVGAGCHATVSQDGVRFTELYRDVTQRNEGEPERVMAQIRMVPWTSVAWIEYEPYPYSEPPPAGNPGHTGR